MRNRTELAGKLTEQGAAMCILWYALNHRLSSTRYIMYVRREEEVYMLDRDNAVFAVPNLKFPSGKRPGQHVKETLIDGVSHYHCSLLAVPLYCTSRRWFSIRLQTIRSDHGT